MINVLQYVEKYWVLISAAILLAITTISLWPLDNLPSVPGSDKTHHLIAYAALVFPTALRKPRRWVWLIAFFVIYSGLIELVQPYVNRYGEWLDMLANTAGIACGLVAASVINMLNKLQIKED
ncbi:MAG: VanZ family protein [Gammaproteobacteria bacterium]|nr:VanZ family protein [Gammaproteobacteria bacterium]